MGLKLVTLHKFRDANRLPFAHYLVSLFPRLLLGLICSEMTQLTNVRHKRNCLARVEFRNYLDPSLLMFDALCPL